jgi:hypothetical protein
MAFIVHVSFVVDIACKLAYQTQDKEIMKQNKLGHLKCPMGTTKDAFAL